MRIKLFLSWCLIIGFFTCTASANKTARFVKNLEAGKAQTIVTFGTSLTKVGAWGEQLQTLLNQQFSGQAKVINGAKGGSNSSWGSKALDKQVLSHKPDTVFIEFAINDAVAKRKVSVAQAQANLNSMIERILKLNTECEIILMTMNVPVGDTGKMRPQIADYYQMYRDVARERSFMLIDHYQNWRQLLKENPKLYIQYVPDTIHPVYEGALKVITPMMVKSLGLAPGKADLSKGTACWKYLLRNMDNSIESNWQVSLQEYELFWAGHFKAQDSNKDGLIQAEEYPEQGVFNYFDANDDGTVNLEEYQKAYAYHFKKFDQENTGILLIREMDFSN